MTTYKQLTCEQRCQIAVLNGTDITQQEMADAVGTSQSTISRELRRNRSQRGYRHKRAQKLADERRHSSAKAVKMTEVVIAAVEAKLCRSGAQSKSQAGSLMSVESASVMSVSTSTFGMTRRQVVSCTPTSGARERSTRIAVTANAAEDRSATV
jgi:IS30 family transposase